MMLDILESYLMYYISDSCSNVAISSIEVQYDFQENNLRLSIASRCVFIGQLDDTYHSVGLGTPPPDQDKNKIAASPRYITRE